MKIVSVNSMRALPLLALLLIPLEALGCSIPKSGYGWGFAELVDNSDSIVLATLVSQDDYEFSTKNTLRAIDVIKGPPVSTVEFNGQQSGSHDGFDYFDHKAPWFWLTWSGRRSFRVVSVVQTSRFVMAKTIYFSQTQWAR